MALGDPQQSHDPTAFYPGDLSAIPLANTDSLPQPTTSALWQAGHDEQQDRRTVSERERLRDAYAPILEILNAGRPRRFWRTDADLNHAFTNPGEWASADEGGGGEREKEEGLIWQAIEAARAKDPKALPGVPETPDELHAQIIKTYEQRRDAAAAVASRSRGIGGWLAQQGGATVEGMNDPLALGTLAIGGMGKNLAQRVLLQGLASGGIQAVQEPLLAKHMGELGDPITPGQAAADIGGATVGGALFQLGIGEPLHALGTLAARKIAGRLTPVEQSAAHVLEREQQVEATSPFTPGAGTETHVARTERARQALTAEPGTVSIAPPPIVADPNARATFMARVRQRESGGSDTARPIDPATGRPLSTAVGRYQFTADTWEHYYRQRFGDQGLTRAQILAKRTDGSLQDTLMQDMTADNARHLARLGVPETAGNLYTEHFLGQGGAEKVFRADPNTPIETLLTAKAINANKFLRGKTAGEVIAWAHARMGETPHNGPVLRRDLFASDEEFTAAQAALDAEERSLAAAQAERVPAMAPDEPATPRPAIDPTETPRIVADAPTGETVAGLQDGQAVPLEAGPASTEFYRSQLERHGADSPSAPIDAQHPLTPRGDDTFYQLHALTRPELEEIARTAPRESQVDEGITTREQAREVLREHVDYSAMDSAHLVDIVRRTMVENRRPDWIERVQSGRGDTGAQAAFVRLGGALAALRERGELDNLTAKLVASLHDQGASLPDAREVMESRVQGMQNATRQRLAAPEGEGPHSMARAREATTGDREALSRYDEPADGPGPRTAIESLEHDIRLDADANPGQTVRLSDEAGEQLIKDVLEDLDGDQRALEAARHCMAPHA